MKWFVTVKNRPEARIPVFYESIEKKEASYLP
jgi:hypothetical protein